MHDCCSEPDENAHRDNEVGSGGTVQLLRERPRDGITVQRLHALPAPNIVANRVQQYITLGPSDGNHNHYGARFVSCDPRPSRVQ